jgi:hypothetical protein
MKDTAECIVLVAFLLMAVNPATATIPPKSAVGDVTPAANPVTTDWIPDQKLPATAQTERHPSIATAGNGSLFAAYEYYNTGIGKTEIEVARSNDGGVSWSAVLYQSSAYDLHYPSIAVDPYLNWVYVVYEREFSSTDYDIHLIRYNGTGWYLEYLDSSGANNDHSPSIVCEYNYGLSNDLFVTWERRESDQDIEIIFAKSTDHGDTWTKSALTSHGVGETCSQPSMTYAASGKIYISYIDNDQITGLYNVSLLRSNNEGTSWTNQLITVFETHDVREPSIAATHGGGLVVVAWIFAHNATDDDIFFSYSKDAGVTWAVTYGMATSTSNERYPHLTVDGMGRKTDYVGDIHATYVRYETVGARINGLYYRKANFANPTSWSAEVQVVDDNAWVSAVYPNIADRAITTVHDNVPVVVWTDYRTPSTYDVYATTLGGKYTIDTSPSGLRVSVDGVLYNAPVSFWWAYKSVHELSVTSPQGPHSFLRWSDGGAQAHKVVAESTAEEYRIAYFTPTLTLLLSPSTVARGSPLTISGQLTPGIATTISLYYRTSTSNPWALATTLPTNAAGVYSTIVTVPNSLPPGTYDLVAVWYNSKNNRYAASDIKKLTIT